MKTTTAIMAVGIGLLGTSACGGDDDNQPPDDPTCDAVWMILAGSGSGAAAIAEGALVLSATDMDEDSEIAVFQSLTGDFDITFSFDPANLGVGAYAQAVIANDDDILGVAGIAEQIVLGKIPFTGVGASTGSKANSLEATTADAGTFRLARNGGTVTVTATAGGDTATSTSEGNATGAVNVGLQLGRHPSLATVVDGESSITVPSFTVNAGDADDDAFDCDTLIR